MRLNEAYERNDFTEFLGGFLPDFKLDTRTITVPTATKSIQNGTHLGRSAALDLDVFEFNHAGGQEKRIALTTDGFRIMKDSASFQALAIFKSPDTDQWRLSLMTATPEIKESGQVITKFSNPKRYSFLLGPGAKINTPTRFLLEKGKVESIEQLKDRFSIEVVNKDFYCQIAKFFNRLTGGDVKFGSKKEHFDSELVLPIDQTNRTTYQEFAVRLIGRIIFSWFLKQKKSDAGISLLPDEFLSVKAVESNTSYYHMVLEKIFFEAMNKPANARRRDLPEAFDQIPFLNGGLFDPHADDYYTDGMFNGALEIPDQWFHEFFEVLETYNFTLDENTVLDVDLSIDPEMLGRIFENLLAEINPETGESARKSTGSYYTPRQIVEYMVDQSLTQYLITKTGIQEPKLKALASVDELDDEENPLTENEKRTIVDALNEVKIIDPACGSGAFPIGILQKIVFMLGRVDPNGRLWFDKKTEGLDPLLQEDFKKKFENENFDYIRKTGIIRDSIYGVDIQPIAVEVSKLRCFLTLIVDEDIDDDADNRGIKPLPNLEFKFVAANTLISLPGSIKKSNSVQQTMFEDESEIQQLKKIRDRYFVSTGYEKNELRSKFKDIQRAIFRNQISKAGQGKMSMALADWDPFKDASSGWFDPEWMFGISDGFDIAIANPPYIRIQTLRQTDNKFPDYLKEHYVSAAKGNYDLYVVFVERGLQLLKKDGYFAYILPHKFFNAQYGQPLRGLLSRGRHLHHIVHFGDEQVFPGATNYVCLFFLSNAGSEDCRWVKVDNLNNWLSTLVAPEKKLNQARFSSSEWNFVVDDGSDLFDKLSSIPSKLRDVARIWQGIVTSADRLYILRQVGVPTGHTVEVEDRTGKGWEIEIEATRPVINNVTISRFTCPIPGHRLILPYKYHEGKPVLISEQEFSESLPRAWAYLKANEQELRSREDGKMDIAGWYGYVYPKNLTLFEAPKLVVQVISRTARFAPDEQSTYFTGGGNGPYYGLRWSFESENRSIQYLQAILNSKLIDWYLHKISSPFRGGYWSYGKQFIDQLPIKEINFESDSERSLYESISNLVDRAISLRSADPIADVAEIEREINNHVYQLYDLGPEEIEIVERES